jgi:AcrR family transcriptional regulator
MSPSRPAPPNDLALDGLHPASNGLGRERVSEIQRALQRARMLSAMVEVTAQHGAGNVTVAHVVARSGVSRRTFYEIFNGREDCFLAAFDESVAQIASEVIPAYDRAGRWQEKIRAGLTALLELLDYERGTGRLVIVETLGAGPGALERRRRVLAQIIAAIDQGRTEGKHSDGPPPLTAEGVVGAVLSVLHARLLACLPAVCPLGMPFRVPPVMGGPRTGEENPGQLTELINPLMSMIVLPYLGPPAARKELERPVPKPRDRSRRRAPADPLPNAWRLTEKGREVERAINTGASPRGGP